MSARGTLEGNENSGSSDRTFGLVFSGAFLILSLWPAFHGNSIRLWALVLSAALALISLLHPALLHYLNKSWTRLGNLIQKITNPVIMGALFYIIITPMGLLMRISGKDPLRRKFDAAACSYWIRRDRDANSPETMRNQF